MRRSISPFYLFTFLLLLTACYNRGPITPDAWNLTEQQLDSISFYTTHHYTQNYNFIVTGDSLVVVAQEPGAMAIPDVVSALTSHLSPLSIPSRSERTSALWWPIS